MDDNLYSKLSEKIQNEISVKKRIFISLLLASSAVIVIFLLFFWLIPVIGLSNIHPLAPILLGILVFFLLYSLYYGVLHL